MLRPTFPPKQSSVVKWITERLATSDRALPAIGEIARQCSVSYLTAWKAVQTLKARKAILCSQGRRPASPDQAGPGYSTARLAEAIRSNILNGSHPIGRNLPKINHFAVTYRVSSRTVVAALGGLCKENLVHRRGRAWISGPATGSAPGHSPASASGDRPVVLIVLHDIAGWYDIYTSHFLSFLASFSTETLYAGMQTALAAGRPLEPVNLIPTGIDEIRSTIDTLGPRYWGALLLVYPWSRDFSFEQMLSVCLADDRPAILFDFAGQGQRLDRGAFPSAKKLYRFHFDHEAATRIVVSTLAAAGHRRIGIPRFTSGDQYRWVDPRIELLRRECARQTPPLELVVVDQQESFWQFTAPQRLHGFNDWARERTAPPQGPEGRGIQRNEPVRSRLLRDTPSLVHLLRQDITALVALNDSMAREYYFWLKSVGVSVPGELSLISFDNRPDAHFLPITTVDFGFPQLGYLAAHAIIGDVTVRCDRQGNLAGTCRIMDRGSVARPGAGISRDLRARLDEIAG